MAKKFTLVLGLVFLVIGIAGYIPALAPANDHGQLLLHIFQINTAQSLIHLVSAAAALLAVGVGGYYVKRYLIVFGVVYTLVALWGITALTGGTHDNVLLGLVHVNMATELLHIAIAASTLYFGLRKENAVAVTANATQE